MRVSKSQSNQRQYNLTTNIRSVNDEINEKNDKNTSNYGASNSKSDSRRPKFISFLLLIKKVILNDLGNERKYYNL